MSDPTSGPVAVDPSQWSCPAPTGPADTIQVAHGGGGRMSQRLTESVFLPAFRNPALEALHDGAVLSLPPGRVAFTTDSYVIHPIFFPGGDIGSLAVHGTVNDLAMCGARPLHLSAGFIIEEGLPIADLKRIVASMAQAAAAAGVTVVTGDTKVVDRGHGDGLYVNTAGVGLLPDGVDLGPHRVAPGDVVIVSGPIAQHGVAVLSVREGLEFGSEIVSDTAALHRLVASLIDAGADLHMLRDPTRGGVAATLNEIAASAQVGVRIVERDVPVADDVRAACGFLGLDPLYVANEGRLVAFVGRQDADRVLALMQAHPDSPGATVIGEVVAEHPGTVVARTGIGGTRVVDLPLAEQLPRIC